MLCPECGGPIEDPGLYLAQTGPAPAVDYCSPTCGAKADASTTNISTARQP